MPLLVGRIVRDAFIDPGIIDENVDTSVEFVQRRVPDRARRCRIGKVAGDQRIAAAGRMADHAVAVRLQ
jgi:hypothetical protein